MSSFRAQGGLGIGLSVVQRLVEMHHGPVEAQSAGVRQGSEFIVRLPTAQAATAPSPSAMEAQERVVSGLCVLVVDDQVDTADSVAMLLRREGHDVRTAYTGAAGLKAVEAYRPNVVLLDIGLPEMDGYEVARRLRAHPRLKHVRLIAITGYGRETDFERSQQPGLDQHIVKPIDLQRLQELLVSLAPRSGE